MSQENFNYDDFRKIRDQQKATAEMPKPSTFTPTEFVQIEYTPLQTGQWRTFQICGLPFEIRRENWHPKLVLQSSILKDDGSGWIKVNWPYTYNKDRYAPDKSWLLAELYEKVMKTGSWVKYTESDVDGVKVIRQPDGKITNIKGHTAYFVPTYKGTPSYERINANQKVNSKMKHNFYPSSRVIMQVIDFNDTTSKHLKILTSKDSPFEIKNKDTGATETIHYYDTGISLSLYNAICEDIVDARKSWNFPIAVYKTGTLQNAYKVKDINSSPMPDGLKVLFDHAGSVQIDNIDNYEKYDSDLFFDTTTYNKQYTNLIGLFKQADIDTGSNFSDRLIRMVEQEKKELEANKAKNVSTPKVEVATQIQAPVATPVATVERPQRIVEEVKKEENFETQCARTFKFWMTLEAEDRNDVLKYAKGIQNGNFVYDPDYKHIALCDNPECQLTLPNSVLKCPKCGTEFSAVQQ